MRRALRERIVTPRIVGREAEFPVVDARGRAADVRRLWDLLIRQGDFVEKSDPGNPNLLVALEGEDFSYALEVGLGTIEVNTRPCDDLFCVQRIMHDAVRPLVRAALALRMARVGLWHPACQRAFSAHHVTEAALSEPLPGHGPGMAVVHGDGGRPGAYRRCAR